MDAIIFDCDGVLVDSEPLHFEGFRRVLAEMGLELTTEDYYGKYVGFDDHDCFTAVLKDNNQPVNQRRIAAMTATKTALVQKLFAEELAALPGVVELVRAADAAGVPMAVCSGALRQEVAMAVEGIGIAPHMLAIVAAEDVVRGKPDPSGYRLALQQLSKKTGRDLRPEATVVIEDTLAGIQSARSAGMNVLAVATSYPADRLTAADRVVNSLEDVTLEDLEALAVH